MTQADLAEAISTRRRLTVESAWHGVMAAAGYLRPADGWISVILLTLNLIVVVWSVDHANWVPTPNLVAVLLLAMMTGLVLSRLPVWGALVFPIGLAVGLLVVTWQMTSFMGGDDAVSDAGQLWVRLGLWWSAAKSGNINIDQVPFAFGVSAASWLSGYLAIWVLSRYRNFWGVFFPGAAGLLSNLTYLPPDASWILLMYLFTALLLVARVQSVRRRHNWSRRNIRFDGQLGIQSFSDSCCLALAVLIVAFLLPAGHTLGPAQVAYDFIRSPLDRWEEDFNRLFAGLPARRPLAYRVWGDVMAFQGTIRPTTAEVLRVQTPVPIYWKARTYGTYTSKGWVSQETTLESLDWVPSNAVPEPTLERIEVNYSVTPNYTTRSVFAGDRILAVDRAVQVETYDSSVYTLDISGSEATLGFPPVLTDAADRLIRITHQKGASVDDSVLAAAMPPDLRLLHVERVNGEAQKVTVAEVLPARSDVLSVRSSEGKIHAGEKYQITSSVSVAKPEALRGAGIDYPAWVLLKYTQLPGDLPQRIRELAAQLTAESRTPYDKAKAIEDYLDTFPYTLTVAPPPYDADGVDHFLFTLKKGYSEYFASSMAVLLRSVGVPARLATGYTPGDKLDDKDIYIVTDSHSHAWVEVFFPRYGWITFEPTKGAFLPGGAVPKLAEKSGGISGDADGESLVESCLGEFEFCGEGDETQSSGAKGSTFGLPARFWAIFLWLLGSLGIAALLAGTASFLWRRYMSSTEDPRTAYRRLALLGTLGSVGPKAHQTPFQYRERLGTAMPGYREEVTTLIDSYVRSQYGAKELSAAERRRLTAAWLRVRLPMLWRVFRWRTS